MDEPLIKVSESKERLDVFDFMGLRPILNGFDFLGRHGEAIRRKDVAEVFCSVSMELALFRVHKKAVLSQSM